MFDTLVESTKQKQGRRARRLFLVTGAIYVVALTALGVATIVGINPALAEGSYILGELIPPQPPQGYIEAPAHSTPTSSSSPSLAPPKKIVDTLPEYEPNNNHPLPMVPGAPPLRPIGPGTGAPGASEEPPPPPPPTPTPAVKPTPAPTPVQVVRLTSVLTQGRVLRRVHPPYPAIAKAARIQGQVQIQIGISETGAVTDVTLLSGHQLLRDAALQAAKQWTFIPTELNGQRVRAIGLLTFNFKLD
ncbi:MAG TPA: energy transducer TonB [Blastocatellia bacterium]|jgi:protein TonB|nr:energy transducer TonB [Blastocatellia bacterium]